MTGHFGTHWDPFSDYGPGGEEIPRRTHRDLEPGRGGRRVSPDHLCPACGGEGIQRFNITRNADGIWECDEKGCYPCNGTGLLVAT